MSDRYSTYSKLKIDYPHQRVLRITFDRPETYNSVDARTSGVTSMKTPTLVRSLSLAPAKPSRPEATLR